MSFCINYEKLLGKSQTIWTKIEDLKTIEFNAFQSMMIDTKKPKYGDMAINYVLIFLAYMCHKMA